MDIFLLFFVLVALAPSQPAHGIEVTDDTIGVTPARVIWYQSENESIDELIGTDIDVLNTEEYAGLPYLSHHVGPDVPPRRWIAFDLQGRIPDDEPRVLTRDDNMYVCGFTNKSGHYHAIKGHESALPPGATVVGTGDSYTDFFGEGGLREGLPRLPMSKELFQDAIHTLATYPNVPTHDFNRAMARMIIVLSEASKIKKVRIKINEIWESRGVESVDFLEEQLADYCLHWADISLFLLCAERNIPLIGRYATSLRRLDVFTIEDAKSILGVIIRPIWFDPDNAEESCRPKILG